jgi:acyl-CoA synthetase
MHNTTLTLLSATQINDFYKSGVWRNDTIYSLARSHAEAAPDAPAIRDRARTLSYKELVEAADRLAATLHDAGIRPGQRVGLWASSRVESAVVMLACFRNSYTCCPSLHRDHTVSDILALMERTKAAAFIGEMNYGGDVQKTDIFSRIYSLDSMKFVLRLGRVGEADADGGLLSKTPTAAAALAPSSDPNRVIYLAFTSGTTGEPKGVMHSDNTLLSNARAIAADWSFGRDSVIYTMSPLSHNLGFGALIASILAGSQLVVHDLPRGASVLDRLLETGTTFLFGVPTHAIDLLTELRARGLSKVGALKGFRISGAAAPKEVVAALMQHGVMPQSGYGMTEACSHHYTLPDDNAQRITETSGKACPGFEAKIWSTEDPDKELPVGEIGQIGGRGGSLMLGYFDDQAATESAFNSHGWFMTGDLGKLDAHGYLVVTGRMKDLIIRGGHNIHPARIEELSMQHPAVVRAAALPVPDQRFGEKVCIAVMLRPGSQISADELLAHLAAAGLSRYDVPEYFLQLDEIPLTASGKISKRDLVEAVRAGRLQPTPVRWHPTIQEVL